MNRSWILRGCCLSVVGLLVVGCGDDDSGTNNGNLNNNGGVLLCGNSEIDGLEECDDGVANSDIQADACRTNCLLPHCGDGVMDEHEECDDGVANSDLVPGACRTDCAAARCGDKVVDVPLGELCDCGDDPSDLADGCTYPNGDPDGFCGPTCQVHMCGNGVLDPGEQCDDGNLASGDGCSANCLSNEVCGNSVVDSVTNEECDDGNAVSHDGCDSGCADERQRWRQWPTFDGGLMVPAMAYHAGLNRLYQVTGGAQEATWEYADGAWQYVETEAVPYLRGWSDMVYDEARQRLVLFGGQWGVNTLGDTWEFDGVRWQLVPMVTQPMPRKGHAMVYDPDRQRAVLFGGWSSSGMLGDTWEYDGTAWVETATALAPVARVNHALAYDPVRQRVVLFGGCDNMNSFGQCTGVDLADTWEYDGTAWTLVSPGAAPEPSARAGHRMAWDPSLGAVLLYGGWTGVTTLGDAWAFDGSDWQTVPTAGGPSARGGHSMAYDAGRQRMVLHGGCATFNDLLAPCASALPDTWEFDGTTWAETTQASQPGARLFGAMTTDTSRGRLILTGGQNETVVLLETWEFDGARWRAGPPSPQVAGHAMAYDPLRDRVVLFGGCRNFGWSWLFGVCDEETDETWEYDGSTWQLQSVGASPGARFAHGMVFDEVRGTVVMHGGTTGITPLNDTWEYDGTAWTQIQTATVPEARNLGAMSYDSARQRIVLTGGLSPTEDFDVWEFDGTDWQQQSATVYPALRVGHLSVYDASRGVTVLFGGCVEIITSWLSLDCGQNLADTWEYDGTQWVPVGVSEWPEARLGHAGAYLPSLRGMFMFGGAQSTSLMYNDTWRYRSDSVFEDEHCFNGLDDDRDGLVDCADPDCEGRPCLTGSCQSGTCQ